MSAEDCLCDNNILVTKKKTKCTCTDCEFYKRKFNNAEQTNSSKSVLIDMLQQELKKKENLYKDLIDEYEKLRFRHCSVVQEMEGLKEVYRRMEDGNSGLLKEREINKNHQKELMATLKDELDHWKKQFQDLQDKIQPSNDLCQKIGRIEKLLQNQGITMIELVRKFLSELRNMNINQTPVPKSCAATITNESGNTNKKIKELEDDNENLNFLVKKLTKENKEMKNRLNEKKQKLSECVCVLEKNEKNMKNISADVTNIITERNKYLQENVKLNTKIKYLQNELQEKSDQDKSSDFLRYDNFHEDSSPGRRKNIPDTSESPLEIQLKNLEEQNRLLNNTINILTDKNQSNMEVIKKMSQKINELVNDKQDIKESLTNEYGKINKELQELKEINERESNSRNEECCPDNIPFKVTPNKQDSSLVLSSNINQSPKSSIRTKQPEGSQTSIKLDGTYDTERNRSTQVQDKSQLKNMSDREGTAIFDITMPQLYWPEKNISDSSGTSSIPQKNSDPKEKDQNSFGRTADEIPSKTSMSQNTPSEREQLWEKISKGSLEEEAPEENRLSRTIGVGSTTYLSVMSLNVSDNDSIIPNETDNKKMRPAIPHISNGSKSASPKKHYRSDKQKKEVVDLHDRAESLPRENITDSKTQSEVRKSRSELFMTVSCQNKSLQNVSQAMSVNDDYLQSKSKTLQNEECPSTRSIGIGSTSYLSSVQIRIPDSDDEKTKKSSTEEIKTDSLTPYKDSDSDNSINIILETAHSTKSNSTDTNHLREVSSSTRKDKHVANDFKSVEDSKIIDAEYQSQPPRNTVAMFSQTESNENLLPKPFNQQHEKHSLKSQEEQTTDRNTQDDNASEKYKQISIQRDKETEPRVTKDLSEKKTYHDTSSNTLTQKDASTSSTVLLDNSIQTDNAKSNLTSIVTEISNYSRRKRSVKPSSFTERIRYLRGSAIKEVDDKYLPSQTEAALPIKHRFTNSSVQTDNSANIPKETSKVFLSTEQDIQSRRIKRLPTNNQTEIVVDQFEPRIASNLQISISDSHFATKSVRENRRSRTARTQSTGTSPSIVDDRDQTDSELIQPKNKVLDLNELDTPSHSYEAFRGDLEDGVRKRKFSTSLDRSKPTSSGKVGHSTMDMQSFPLFNIDQISISHDKSSGPDEISTAEESLQTENDINWSDMKKDSLKEGRSLAAIDQKSKIPIPSTKSSRAKQDDYEQSSLEEIRGKSHENLINKKQLRTEELQETCKTCDKESKTEKEIKEYLIKKDQTIDKLNKEMNALRNVKSSYDRCLRHTKVLQDKLKNLDQKLKEVHAENKEIKVEKEYLRNQLECGRKKQLIKTADFSCDFKSCCDNYNQLIHKRSKKNLEIQNLENLDYDISGLNNIISIFKEKLGELEEEICKKNCLILSLETCVDKNNEILGDCEKEIRSLLKQNEYLKETTEQLDKISKTPCGCQSTSHIEKKISGLVKEYGELLKEAKEKDLELEDIKRKYDKLCSSLGYDKTILQNRGVCTRGSSPMQYSCLLKSAFPQDENNYIREPLEKNSSDRELPKRRKKKYSCKEKIHRSRPNNCSDISASYTTDSPKESQSPPSDEILENLQRKKMKKKPSKTNESCKCWKHLKTRLKDTGTMKKEEPSLVELMRKSSNKLPTEKTDIPVHNESVKRLNNEKVNLQLKLNSLQHDFSQMLKEQSDLKSGITCLLNEIINKMKILTDAKDGVSSHSSPGTVAGEVLDSLTKLERTLSTKKSCNCMSVIKSKYLIDQHGLARQMYQPLFSKFFCDYSSESKSNNSSVEIFDVTELEVEKDVSKSNDSCRC